MADFVAFRPIARDTSALFGGVIPSELACAAFHVAHSLDRKTLLESLVRVAHVKKCGRYEAVRLNRRSSRRSSCRSGPAILSPRSARRSSRPTARRTWSLILRSTSSPSWAGLLVKKWDGSRNYAAIETAESTLMWFFILMREYLDGDGAGSTDLRSLVLDQKEYTEY